MAVGLFFIFLLLALSASFSSLETALFSLTPLQRYRMKESGGIMALIPKALEKPRELLTTVLFGNELVNVGIAIIAGSITYHFFGGTDTKSVYLISTVVTTIVLLLFGEIVPKNVAIRYPLLLSQVLIVPYQLVAWVAYPFRVVFTKIADVIVSLFGADPQKGRRLIVEEELRSLLELGGTRGTLADLERTLLQNALDFSGIRVPQVMIPREEIISTTTDADLEGVLEILRNHRLSRLPVYDSKREKILGVLHAKELLPLKIGHPEASPSLKDHLKPFAEVGPDETLDQVFRKFQRRRIHMGIVQDPSGTILGLITMDDLLRRFFP